MKHLQERRFLEGIKELLGEGNKVDLDITEGGTLEMAKINTDKELDDDITRGLINLSAAWACKLYIKRSGAGIRIKFVLDAQYLSPEQKAQYDAERLKGIPVKNAHILEAHRGH